MNELEQSSKTRFLAIDTDTKALNHVAITADGGGYIFHPVNHLKSILEITIKMILAPFALQLFQK